MPQAVQDYLMIHELSHLTYMNHGAEYWALVAQFCPDYKLHRRWLNENKDAIFADVELTYQPENDAPLANAAQPTEQTQEVTQPSVDTPSQGNK